MTQQGGTFPVALIVLIAVLIGVVIVGTVVLLLVRRWAYSDAKTSESGLTLDSLRKLYEAGDLSLEEYEAARDAIVGRISPGRHPKTARSLLPGERRALPGYDLSGEPLPDFDGEGDADGPDSAKDQPPRSP